MMKPRLPKPPGGKPGDRRPPSGPRPVPTIWYLVGFFLLLAVVQAYLFMPSGRTVAYSEFKALLAQDKVAEVVVTAEVVRGQLKEQDAGGKPQAFVTTRVEDPKLVEELEQRKVKYTGEVTNRWLPELLGWVLPLLLIVGLTSFFFRRMSGGEGGVMSFARSRGKIYAEDDVKVTFSDVAGVDEAVEELKEVVEFLKTPKKYMQLGGRIPKGVLLVGPPGTGKTLLARAIAGEAHVPFFSLSGSEFVEMFVGVGAARVRDLFQQAEAKAPCIVFIDELDALGKTRVQNPLGGHEEREQTLNQLLAEMDGFDSRKGVIIMGATNRPEVLDPALLRPGRFDRQVLVDKPDVRGREAILKIHARGVKTAPEVDLVVVAARTAGFAGADLANLVNEAALLAARKDKPSVERADFDEAIERSIAGLEKKRVMSDREREIIAYHEAGHAVIATVIPGLDPVHKILDRPTRLRRTGLHDAAAPRGPLPDDPDGAQRSARGAARRPDGRGSGARGDFDGRAERPPAGQRHRARDGGRVRHVGIVRRDQFRQPRAKPIPGRGPRAGPWQLFRGDCAGDRRGGAPHRPRCTRARARAADRASRHPGPRGPAAAGERSDRGGRTEADRRRTPGTRGQWAGPSSTALMKSSIVASGIAR